MFFAELYISLFCQSMKAVWSNFCLNKNSNYLDHKISFIKDTYLATLFTLWTTCKFSNSGFLVCLAARPPFCFANLFPEIDKKAPSLKMNSKHDINTVYIVSVLSYIWSSYSIIFVYVCIMIMYNKFILKIIHLHQSLSTYHKPTSISQVLCSILKVFLCSTIPQTEMKNRECVFLNQI